MLYQVGRLQKEVVKCLDLVSAKLGEIVSSRDFGCGFFFLFDPAEISHASNMHNNYFFS